MKVLAVITLSLLPILGSAAPSGADEGDAPACITCWGVIDAE